MRKIYQSVPDVPQAVANKAVDLIERHFAVCGVRRAADLPEESKVHLFRELRQLFSSELQTASHRDVGLPRGRSSEPGRGFIASILHRLERALRRENS